MSFKHVEELKRALKANDEEALSGLISMNRELPKTQNIIGMIDLGVEFNASYCSMLAARNLGLTSLEKQCEKTALSRRWPPGSTATACATTLTLGTWRSRCWLFSTRRRSGKVSKQNWLWRNPRIPKRRRQERWRATASRSLRGRGRTGAQGPRRTLPKKRLQRQ